MMLLDPDGNPRKIVDHPSLQQMRAEMGEEAFDRAYNILIRGMVRFGPHILLMGALANPDLIREVNAELNRPAPLDDNSTAKWN